LYVYVCDVCVYVCGVCVSVCDVVVWCVYICVWFLRSLYNTKVACLFEY